MTIALTFRGEQASALSAAQLDSNFRNLRDGVEEVKSYQGLVISEVVGAANGQSFTMKLSDGTVFGPIALPPGPPGPKGNTGGPITIDAPNDGRPYSRQSAGWVLSPSGGEGSGISDANADGFFYGRQDNAWSRPDYNDVSGFWIDGFGGADYMPLSSILFQIDNGYTVGDDALRARIVTLEAANTDLKDRLDRLDQETFSEIFGRIYALEQNAGIGPGSE